MPEDRRLPLVEVWVWEKGVQHRVWRGRNPAHLQWKLEHHAKEQPETRLIEAGDPSATTPAAG